MHNFLAVFILGLIAIFIILPISLCFEIFKTINIKSLSRIYKVLFYDENNKTLPEGKAKEYND